MDFESGFEKCHDLVDLQNILGEYESVVNVDDDEQEARFRSIIDATIVSGLLEFERLQETAELFVPLPGRLFESIKALFEEANLLGAVLEPFRLLHEDSFFEIAVEKCSFDVELFDFEFLDSCIGE